MTFQSPSFMSSRCAHCADSHNLGLDFTMAFQPIVDCVTKRVFGYEALVRGCNNESAFSIISQISNDKRYGFDQLCRIKAISLAARLKLPGMLSINFLPNAIYRPERCIRSTLEAARKYQFPIKNIMFEFTENEQAKDSKRIQSIIECYKKLGFKTAIDDFGSGYSGLNLLADFQTDIVKLDMALIRDIDRDETRQTIVTHCINMLKTLNIKVLGEGIETEKEYRFLKGIGIDFAQGYYFARPGFESLPEVDTSLI
ncbi:diguanylate phosphodiesterase [Lonsdalea populi]|uniref:EAL domain-containing protein n=1 Tax=Lonsdalea TaxID=1082702 RepID=UPI000A1FE896|nr:MULTISPECIES: EAL domain-containing protein [Lonsdalea]OSN00782.1 diguanylate phosphodiesterase [Lonsdalea populi]QPQ24301.1 EAL domain-containing protein [Lonsdalea populi]RAT17121.1 diguanylate phosphodiesterase [Lonsdalea quercina]RAT29924.1 diguanylate phosphodiesterase [Lonsdalea populi]RAT31179.1 diguanylate phosphodiesterase [Lonsdalea populi]